MPARRSSSPAWLRHSLAVVLGVAFALLGSELAARRFAGWPSLLHYTVFDAELGHRMKPYWREDGRDDRGAYPTKFNSEGFRSRPLPERPKDPAGPPRLLVLGDSFLHGYGVGEGERFSELAVAAAGGGFELHHVHADDWGTGQELLALRRYGPHIAPDAIVLAMFPGNDVANNYEGFAGVTGLSPSDAHRPYVAPDGRGGEVVRYAHSRRAFWRRRSALFAQLESRFVRARWWEAYPGIEARAPDSPWHLIDQFLTPPEPSPGWDAAWERTEFLIERTAAEARALGARFCVLVIPTLHQVEYSAILAAAEHEARQLEVETAYAQSDFELPERRLASFFDRTGIEWVQCLDALRASARTSDGNYLLDGHLNHVGHRVVGEQLAPWLLGEEVDSSPPRTRGPVDMRAPKAEAPNWLDFSAGTCRRYVARGFPWRREPGWLQSPHRMAELTDSLALLLVQPAPGPIGIRGAAANDGTYPVEIVFRALGGDLGRVQLERPGPFDNQFSSEYQALIEGIPKQDLPYVQLHLAFPDADRPTIGVSAVGFFGGQAEAE